jgi:hypothetical protein
VGVAAAGAAAGAAANAGAASRTGPKSSRWTSFAGAGVAGGLELALFHPLDTVAKRLMNNREGAEKPLMRVIFPDPEASKIRSLLPGIGYAAIYKVSQRLYKFGTQPIVKGKMQEAFPTASPLMLSGTAGAIVGVGEVALLPFDVLKIKMQTNAAALQGMSFVDIAKQEGVSGLYRGASWTALRNAPGSFSLFGMNSFVKETVFGCRDRRATLLETFCASSAGGVASVLVACPVDVIKTRLQSGTFGETSGVAIIRDIVRDEGVGGFFKGSVPKVSMTAPKLIFSFTVAQWVADWFKHNL